MRLVRLDPRDTLWQAIPIWHRFGVGARLASCLTPPAPVPMGRLDAASRIGEALPVGRPGPCGSGETDPSHLSASTPRAGTPGSWPVGVVAVSYRVAQPVERGAVTSDVAGSSPAPVANNADLLVASERPSKPSRRVRPPQSALTCRQVWRARLRLRAKRTVHTSASHMLVTDRTGRQASRPSPRRKAA